jgi:hypothetical protein
MDLIGHSKPACHSIQVRVNTGTPALGTERSTAYFAAIVGSQIREEQWTRSTAVAWWKRYLTGNARICSFGVTISGMATDSD